MFMPATLPPESGVTREAAAAPLAGLTLLVVGDGAVSTHELPGAGTVVLGRAPTCDVVIDDPSVSRVHAVLHLGAGALTIEDRGSANGTRVRDGRLAAGEPATFALDEPIGLGSVTVIAQRRASSVRPRRVWSHGYFEGRLEDECARAERFGQGFALLHLVLEKDLHADVVRGAMTEVLRSVDVLGSYGPSEYEILLVATSRDEAETLAGRIVSALDDRGARPRLGLAHYPSDSRSPDVLAQLANDRVRGVRVDEARQWVVRSERMREIYEVLGRIAGGDISVLLLGETGVGKEVVAEAVHRLSPRATRPFLRLNCAALSETLLESELFGHERGAFTGATQAKPGLLETASGGTVFLDEIGELPMSVQVKLLRVIEERKVLRVGGLSPQPIDVRFVAATNRDLDAEIRRGAFREDLYYRLNGFAVWIPPLRERNGEIEPLARHFIADFCRRNARYPEPGLSREALEWLLRYRWPGNIRELRNIIERAVLLCTADEITPRQLPLDKLETAMQPRADGTGRHAHPTVETGAGAPAMTPALGTPTSLGLPLGAARGRDGDERSRVIAALEQCAGNQTRAAILLGISRRTLVNRLNEFGLARPRKGTAPERA
jgi:two-component system response regulator AtoC